VSLRAPKSAVAAQTLRSIRWPYRSIVIALPRAKDPLHDFRIGTGPEPHGGSSVPQVVNPSCGRPMAAITAGHLTDLFQFASCSGPPSGG
jgi:hypothetical protein